MALYLQTEIVIDTLKYHLFTVEEATVNVPSLTSLFSAMFSPHFSIYLFHEHHLHRFVGVFLIRSLGKTLALNHLR